MAEAAVPGGDPLGARLTQIRIRQGRSQLQIAELLCAASGLPTVTRHEVSRWEREQRVPSPYWLRWLAVVLDVPLDELERAAAITRAGRAGRPEPRLGRQAAPAAPAWRRGFTVPVAPAAPAASEAPMASAAPAAPAGSDAAATPFRRWSTAELRRLDDLVGGADLSDLVNGALRIEARAVRAAPTPARLAGLAELAQLAGWVNGDAGDARAARAAHRLGLRAARQAGDPALVGHLLSTAAQVSTDPVRALALARAGATEAARAGSATARALSLQRVAHAAALTGDARRCERAITAAERMYGRRRPDLDPSWVYWLTDDEFAAMTGRCYAILRRPRLAVPLLSHALAGIRHPRSAALYRGWLAEAHLDAGAPDAAAPLAARALLDAVRAGSVRAAERARALHARLVAAPRSAVDGYLRVAAGALGYLADVTSPAGAALAGSG
jgi:transcriptional regulator with XRE-family HTH domain